MSHIVNFVLIIYHIVIIVNGFLSFINTSFLHYIKIKYKYSKIFGVILMVKIIEDVNRDSIRNYTSKIRKKLESINRLTCDDEYESISEDDLDTIVSTLKNIYDKIGLIQITYTEE